MKLLFTLGFVSSLSATSLSMISGTIEDLKSTGIISPHANIPYQSRKFDEAISEMWDEKNIVEIQNHFEKLQTLHNTADSLYAKSEIPSQPFFCLTYIDQKLLSKICNELSRKCIMSFHKHVDYSITPGYDKSVLYLEIKPFILKCIEEHKTYIQENITNSPFIYIGTNLIKYNAIFNSKLNYGKKIPDFIALFYFSYLFKEFKNELTTISQKSTIPTCGVFGNISDILNEISNDIYGFKLFDDNKLWAYIRKRMVEFFSIKLDGQSQNVQYFEPEIISDMKNYHELVFSEFAMIFLKSLNIDYINTNWLSIEFSIYANQHKALLILINALNTKNHPKAYMSFPSIK